MKSLSLVMIVKNEENNIRRCLESVKGIVDEIVIVDTGSIDKTKDIALEFNAKIFDYKWDNNFAKARNYSIKNSSGDWNLILDADEYISNINLTNIKAFINSDDNKIGQIKIVNVFEQDGEIRASESFISRLVPKDVLFEGAIHEQLKSDIPRQVVDIELSHDGYLNPNKFDRNISILLNELKIKPNDSYLLYQTARTYYVNKMYSEASTYFNEFYNHFNYDTEAFVEDGLITYIYTVIKTNEFEKGLKIINDNFDLLKNSSDFYFVCGVFFTELVSSNPEKYINYFENIELSYLGALEIGDTFTCNGIQGTGSYLAAFNLGVFYELMNNLDNAIKYYELSAKYNYNRALEALQKYA